MNRRGMMAVQESVDPTILYNLTEDTYLNGTSDYIDTGIQIFKLGTSFTFLFDGDVVYNSTQYATIWSCKYEVSPYLGISSRFSGTNVGVNYNISTAYKNGWDIARPSTSFRYRTVWVYDADAGKHSIYQRANTGTVDVKSVSTSVLPNINNTVLVGCYETSTGVKGRFVKETVHQATIYSRALSSREISDWIDPEEPYSITVSWVGGQALPSPFTILKLGKGTSTINSDCIALSSGTPSSDWYDAARICVYHSTRVIKRMKIGIRNASITGGDSGEINMLVNSAPSGTRCLSMSADGGGVWYRAENDDYSTSTLFDAESDVAQAIFGSTGATIEVIDDTPTTYTNKVYQVYVNGVMTNVLNVDETKYTKTDLTNAGVGAQHGTGSSTTYVEVTSLEVEYVKKE